jgi:hypothetical protein
MTSDRTLVVVRQQTEAMACEVGVYRPEAPGVDARMLLRVWDRPGCCARCHGCALRTANAGIPISDSISDQRANTAPVWWTT